MLAPTGGDTSHTRCIVRLATNFRSKPSALRTAGWVVQAKQFPDCIEDGCCDERMSSADVSVCQV